MRLSLALLLGSSLAWAKPYVYLVREIPVLERNCHEEAARLASRFTDLTGLTATGRCEKLSTKGADIAIRYEATEALSPVRTSAEIGFPGRGHEFSSRRKCEAELPGESAFFKETVGKEPLVAFCRWDETYYGLQKWALVLEGFGTPTLLPQWASTRFPGRPTQEQTAVLVQQVKNVLTSSQAQVRFVFLQEDEHGALRLTVHYWGRYGEQLQALSLAEVNSVSDCAVALEDLQQINASVPEIKTVGLCVANPYARGANLVAVVDVTQWHALKQAVETFPSYSECASQKDSLVDFYKNQLGDKILAGFCTRWGNDWKLNLVEKR